MCSNIERRVFRRVSQWNTLFNLHKRSCIMYKSLALRDLYNAKIASNKDDIDYVNLYLKDGCSLTEKEQDLINRLNSIITQCEQDDDLFDKISAAINVEFDDKLPHIKVLSEKRLFAEFNDINTYSIKKGLDGSSSFVLNFNEFTKMIRDNNIKTLFSMDFSVSIDDNMLDDDNVISFVSEKYSDVTLKIVKSDISCFNRIIKKVDFDTPVKRRYYCQFNGVTFIAEEDFYCNLNTDVLLCLIIIMHFDELDSEIEKKQKLIEEEENDRRQKYIDEMELKLKALREKIINDPAFRMCTKNNTLRYLKELLRTESDDILYYLGMSRTSTGQIRMLGYKGQSFIDDVWEEMRRAK